MLKTITQKMTRRSRDSEVEEAAWDVPEEQLDCLFDALAVERRQKIICCPAERTAAVALADLAPSQADLASHKRVSTSDDPPLERVELLRAQLEHLDVPTLSQAGLVHYDPDRCIVQLTELARLSEITDLLDCDSVER